MGIAGSLTRCAECVSLPARMNGYNRSADSLHLPQSPPVGSPVVGSPPVRMQMIGGDPLKTEIHAIGTMGLQVAGPGAADAGKINSIILGGPADINGTLREQDILVAVDHQEVNEQNFVSRIRGSDMLGQRQTLTVNRQGQYIDVSLTRTSSGVFVLMSKILQIFAF
jgi:S1-C subfamily serine protease